MGVGGTRNEERGCQAWIETSDWVKSRDRWLMGEMYEE